MKKIITVSLALVLTLGTLTSCSILKKGKELTENIIPKETQPQQQAVPDETQPVEEESNMNLRDHLGNWHPESEAGEKELRITEASNNHVKFSLWYEDGTELENVVAELSGDTAAFGMSDTAETISGELVFGDTYIKLRIDDTNVSFFDVGLTVYDGRHSARYEETQTEDVIEEYRPSGSSLEPSTYIHPFTQYVNTGGDTLHLRIGPGQDYTSICLMPDNAPVTVMGYSDDGEWSYVHYISLDVYGWCFNQYLAF